VSASHYDKGSTVEVQIDQPGGKIWVLGFVRESQSSGLPVVGVPHGRSFINVAVTDCSQVRAAPKPERP
jgi:hypothetical protein